MTGRHLPDEAREAGAVCVRASGPLTDADRQAIAEFRAWLATAPKLPPRQPPTDEEATPDA